MLSPEIWKERYFLPGVKNGIRKREKEIEALQTEMASLEKIIYAPGFYETAVDPQLKFDEYSRLKKRLENAEEAWTQMQIDKEALESECRLIDSILCDYSAKKCIFR